MLWTLGFAVAIASAQPAFDVASVKRTARAEGGIELRVQPASLTLRGATLGYCVRWAYGIRPDLVERTVGPEWIDPPTDVRYDIAAKTAGPVPEAQMRLMLRSLLAERFHLALHREMRPIPVYALVLDPAVPTLRRSTAAEARIAPHGSAMTFDCIGVSMERLSQMLGPPWTTRAIVDETGLLGSFDFTLDLEKYRQYDAAGNPVLDATGRVDLESAVAGALRALGLKLQAKKEPVEVLVVDHADKNPVEQ